MALKNVADLKTGRDFADVLDSMHNRSNVQRVTSAGAFTIADTTTMLSIAVDGAMGVVTMPAAIVGRNIRMFWEVEQATGDMVATCAGSDTFAGNIFSSVAGDSAGDGDVTAIANTIVAITFVDDVNIGSYVDFQCCSKGLWLTTGHLVLDAVGNVPTLA
jgi:hypothetical protein